MKEQYLSAKQVIERNLVPWIKSIPTLTKLINEESRKRNSRFPLKVIVKGQGRKRRYFIERSSLIGIVKRIEKNKKTIVKV